MKKQCVVSGMRFASAGAALLLAMFAMPLIAHAQSQSKYANATITVRSSNSDEGLDVWGNGCGGTLTGRGLFLEVGDSCWVWSDINAPRAMDVHITADKITFVHNGKNYSIHDAAIVKQARSLLTPMEDVIQQQSDLGKQQATLGQKQRALREQQREVKVKVPDMSPDFAKVEADAKRLSAEGGTQSELGDLQSEIGDLQSRVGDLQSQAGEAQSKFGDQQSELGDQRSDLGEKRGQLAERAGKMAVQVVRQLKELLDQSISSGAAKPE